MHDMVQHTSHDISLMDSARLIIIIVHTVPTESPLTAAKINGAVDACIPRGIPLVDITRNHVITMKLFLFAADWRTNRATGSRFLDIGDIFRSVTKIKVALISYYLLFALIKQ